MMLNRAKKLFLLLVEYKYYFSLISVLIVGLWIAPRFISFKDNFWSISALAGTIIGLFYTIDERRTQRFFTTIEKINSAIAVSFEELNAEMSQKDIAHDTEIAQLYAKIVLLEVRLDSHIKEFGHQQIIVEVFKIKDAISEVNAHLAVVSQQGRLLRQIEQIKSDLVLLQKETSKRTLG